MVHHLEEHDLVAVEPEPLQHRLECVEVGAQEIAEHHDDLAPPDAAVDVGEASCEVGLVDRFDAVEKLGDADDLRHRVARRHVADDLLVEGRQRHLIALLDDAEAQRGRHPGGVEQFLGIAVAVAHRLADVEHEVADEVRLHLVLLDEVLIASVEDPPIDVPWVVARHVFTVAGELHREAGERRLVLARERPHHQAAWLDRTIGHAAQGVGVEVAGDDALGHGETRGD